MVAYRRRGAAGGHYIWEQSVRWVIGVMLCYFERDILFIKFCLFYSFTHLLKWEVRIGGLSI